jgi:hypothetical protein
VEEVKRVVKEAPREKAPVPNGFIGIFVSECWNIIKEDLMSVVQQFYNVNQQELHLLNQAFVVLVPKISNPQKIWDYRSISLIHSFVKIISKLLANRLTPHLDQLISVNQTAFIQKRCIHDNFIYVQQVVKELHKKIPSLFIKLDISKTFDTVNRPFLLDILSHLGFGLHWREWISMLWCTTSSSYLVNGILGRTILHYRGVRQGDPLPSMLFLLAMEPLHRLFQKAQQVGLISSLSRACDSIASLYADDAAVFIKPIEREL